MSFRLRICIILILAISNTLYAKALSLNECIETALKENPQITITQKALVSAKAKRREAFAGHLPKIDASITYMKRNEVEGADTFSAMSDAFLSFFADSIYDSRLSLTQPVFMWGRIYQANKQASLNYKAVDQDLVKTKNEVTFNVKKAFYGYLLAKQLVLISKEAYDVTKSHLNMVEGFYKEGKSSAYDVSRAKVSLANVKTNLIKAENGLELAKQSLINTINIKDSNIDFSGELKYNPADFALDDLIASAQSNRPELKKIELQEKMAMSIIKITRAGNKPNIVLTGYKQWQSTELKFSGAYETWALMGVLNVPLFDGFATHHKTKQAKMSLEQLKESKKALIEGIKLETKAAYLNYKQAKESIEANKENVELAKENLRIAQERFKLGLMSDIEVRDAQLALTQAETNYIQAMHDYAVAIAQINKATGINTTF